MLNSYGKSVNIITCTHAWLFFLQFFGWAVILKGLLEYYLQTTNYELANKKCFRLKQSFHVDTFAANIENLGNSL